MPEDIDISDILNKTESTEGGFDWGNWLSENKDLIGGDNATLQDIADFREAVESKADESGMSVEDVISSALNGGDQD